MKRKVLIVEDNAVLAESYSELMIMQGYDVVGMESTGKAAIESTLENNPDLLIMDISLDGTMDGIAAAIKIIEHRSIPIIFISGFSDDRRRTMIDEIPGSRYVMKPTDFNVLAATVSELLSAG